MILLLAAALAGEPERLASEPERLAESVSLFVLPFDASFDFDHRPDLEPRNPFGGGDPPAASPEVRETAFGLQLFPRLFFDRRRDTTTRTDVVYARGSPGVGIEDDRETLLVNASMIGELGIDQRHWTPASVFVGGRAELSSSHRWRRERTSLEAQDPTRSATLGALMGVGVGYGRLLDRTMATRLSKLERALIDDGVLAGPMGDDVRRAVADAWFARNNRLGSLQLVEETERILDEAGLLLRPFDLRAGYLTRNVVDDHRLVTFREGVEVALWADVLLDGDLEGPDAVGAFVASPVLQIEQSTLMSPDESLSWEAEAGVLLQRRIVSSGLESYDPFVLEDHAYLDAAHLRVGMSWFRAFYNSDLDRRGQVQLGVDLQTAMGFKGRTRVSLPARMYGRSSVSLEGERSSLSGSAFGEYAFVLDRQSQLVIRASVAASAAEQPAVAGTLSVSLRMGVVQARWSR